MTRFGYEEGYAVYQIPHHGGQGLFVVLVVRVNPTEVQPVVAGVQALVRNVAVREVIFGKCQSGYHIVFVVTHDLRADCVCVMDSSVAFFSK